MKNSGDIPESQFHKNIVLPIKPNYAEKILSNEKKYEFRKKICTENIDKIYLYATSPVKKIVGEAEVLEKIMMDKKTLWKLTEKQAGITADYYEKYFLNCEMACAYKIGKVKRYDQIVKLSDVGISYVPQSFAYVESLEPPGTEKTGFFSVPGGL